MQPTSTSSITPPGDTPFSEEKRRQLAAGEFDFLAYKAPELGNRLVHEYPDGSRDYVEYDDNGEPTLTRAPARN